MGEDVVELTGDALALRLDRPLARERASDARRRVTAATATPEAAMAGV
jgi:hypothetical protein